MKKTLIVMIAVAVFSVSCVLLVNAVQTKQPGPAETIVLPAAANRSDILQNNKKPNSAGDKIRGKRLCTLLDKGKGDKIELYSDDSGINRYDASGLAVQYYQIVKTGVTSSKVLLTYKKYIPKDKTLTTMSMPITDMLVSDDIIKLLVQDDTHIVYVERKLNGGNENILGRIRFIYNFKWIPSLNAGRVLDAVFVRPDIVKISNSTGAEYCIRISDKEYGYPVAELVWKNGLGESFTSKLRYPRDKPLVLPLCPYISTGKINGYDRIGSGVRKKMLETMRKNADILKVEDGPTDTQMPEFADDKNIHVFGL